jgi:phospholipid/cholesterol/gamma-HCH transport system substrate-binding protein
MGGAAKRVKGMSPFAAGAVAIAVIAIACFFVFTRTNPFASPYKLTAVFNSANGIQPNSPVREAGVNVGRVTKVEPIESGKGAARVEMEVQKQGLPIHRDATLKIRPRIFLEGNFFVDLQPGSPTSPKVNKGDHYVIPVQQTATPVQFGQVITALQSDTRTDLQTFLAEYSKALDKGGAEGWRQAARYWSPAYRYSALANDATLGEKPHDLSDGVLRGQEKVFGALSHNETALKDLVTNLNTTFQAFANEDVALQRSIPALDAVVTKGTPALRTLNGALPALRAFSRDALPGVKSSGPTIDASMPFVTQARRLVSERELKGLSRDLRVTIPPLTRLNRGSIPLLSENRQLSSCQNNVLLPFAKEKIPDPDFPDNSDPFYKVSQHTWVGLAGESRITDANTPTFRVLAGGGPFSIVQQGSAGENFVAQAPFPIEATRPAKPAHRPVFRPGIACETQQPPDLNAMKG